MPEIDTEQQKISATAVLDSVADYYGKVLKKSEDLKTNACCTGEKPPPYVLTALRNIHPEVSSKYYGCGLVLPEKLEGLRVLDLGCGAGRDVYMLSQFVGAEGFVVGVDMTEEQLHVANEHVSWHMDKFGYKSTNVAFKHGFIERLGELDIEPVDVIVSNCVINLSPDKEAVLAGAYKLLKPGGEVYFSDVYSNQRVPAALRNDEVLWGECLSGALYWNDFLTLAKQAGFGDPRLVKDEVITIANEAVQEKIGHLDFYSATYRLFKLDGLEGDCEDYGQAVIYNGGIPQSPHYFDLDGHHRIWVGKVFPVCGNTWRMLHDTRFKPHFQFIGNFETHYGIFAGCGKDTPFTSKDSGASGGSCC